MEKTGKAFIIIILVVVLAIAGIWYALLELQKRSFDSSIDMYSFVASDAAVIIHIKETDNILNELFANDFFAEPAIKSILGQIPDYFHSGIDSLKILKPNLYNEIIASQCLISIHHRQEKQHYLFQFRFSKRIDFESISQALEILLKSKKTESLIFLDSEIITSEPNNSEEKISWTYFKGSLLISKNKQIIEQSITNFSTERSIDKDEEFKKIRRTAGIQNNNIFIDYRKLSSYDNDAFKERTLPLGVFSNIANWGAYDIISLDNQIMLNGYLSQSVSGNCFLSSIQNQASFDEGVFSIIPEGTILLNVVGIKNMASMTEKLKSYFSGSDYYFDYLKNVSIHDDKYSIKSSEIQNYIDGFLALGLVSRNINENFWFSIIKIKNSDDFVDSILTERTNLQITQENIDYTDINNDSGTSIYSLSEDNMLLQVISGGLLSMSFEYVAINDSLLIATNDSTGLIYILNSIKQQKSIKTQPNFSSSLNSFHKNSNYFFYSAFPEGFDKETLSSNAFDFLNKNKDELSAYGNVGIEILQHRDGLFYNVISITGKNEYKKPKSGYWELKLDTIIHKGPYLVNNHIDGSKEIILQDKLNNLYLINDQGVILWKQKISGPIMSDIIQVDIYKNNRYQYIFNTRNFIHLLDRNGQYVSGYPIRLKNTASAGLAVFDYDNNKNYRIIIPAENKRIYNFNITGRSIDGWTEIKTNDTVLTSLQHLKIDGKDYIFVKDKSGNIYASDRRGISRINIPKNIVTSSKSNIYLGYDNETPFFITSRINGEIIRIYLNDKTEVSSFIKLSNNHCFTFSNFRNHDEKDIIFLDNGNLYVFDIKGEEYINKQISTSKNIVLGNIITIDEENYIQIVDIDNSQVVLINKNGYIENDYSFESDSQIILEDYKIENKIKIISAHKNYLKVYEK
ncbi:MAG: hypothetical protein KGZ97_06440 [Bacteroidetes bacterium]|nr:hypothetical protein [Bacteroidota bacterium]